MEKSSDLNQINCPLHSDEFIQRVSLDPWSDQTLFCLECILNLEKSVKSKLIDYKNLSKSLYQNLPEMNPFRISSSCPSTLYSVLKEREAHEAKFSEHIRSQKEKVCINFKKIQDDVIKLIEEGRNRILNALDLELSLFKKNFETYSSIISSTFSSSEEKKFSFANESHLFEDLNTCNNPFDLSSKIKSYALDAIEYEEIISLKDEDRELHLLNSLKDYNEKIEKAIKSPVISSAASDLSSSINFRDLFKSIEEFTRAVSVLKNPGRFLKDHIASQILDPNDLPFMKQIIKQDQYIKLKPLKFGRTSDTGFSFESFIEIWLTRPHLICLCKSEKTQNVVGVFKECPGLKAKTISFDLKKKFQYQVTMLHEIPQKRIHNYFPVSNVITLQVPPAQSYNGLFELMNEENEDYQPNSEEIFDMRQKCFKLDALEILEIDYKGRKNLETLDFASLFVNTSKKGKSKKMKDLS